ncbi:MAG: hypothetical protein HY748_18255 [Elusimicrobia bacterium]|nr:hypothetical protein [Elusimicrobiota bacterium]
MVLLVCAAADVTAAASAEGGTGASRVEGGCRWGEGALAYFNLPLETQRVTCPSRGIAVLETYGEALRTPFVRYRHPKGWLMRAPVLSVRASPADDVEIQVGAPAQVWARGDDGAKRNDGGDIVLGTKWTALREKGLRPALGFRWAVKLPNTSEETGLGTDQTDVMADLILSKTVGRVQLDGNLGLVVMGDPLHEVDQVDVLTGGLAASVLVGPGLAAVFEVEGASGRRIFDPQAVMRAGAVWQGPWPTSLVYGALTKGLASDSPEWGCRLGFGWALSFAPFDIITP